MTHLMSCSKCPEPLKASLAFLGHRSVLQKSELGGSWKKTFFKKVWDRLHIEKAGLDGEDEGEEADSGLEGQEGESAAAGGGGSETEDEELGEGMENLIAAAAIWLTEQETTDGGSRGRTARGRGLPGAKRPASSPRSAGGSSPKKRRL